MNNIILISVELNKIASYVHCAIILINDNLKIYPRAFIA